MQELEKHETLEIELLEKLKNGNFLNPLVFMGGTMLRLCHELPRYSVDLDFWIYKDINYAEFFTKLKNNIEENYTITDAANKKNTILIELKSAGYRRALKIEIRKPDIKLSPEHIEDKIAFSTHSNKQVFLKGLTLEKTISLKIEAAVHRREIRDVYDIEFIARRGIPFSPDPENKKALLALIKSFSKNEFSSKLGSLLPKEQRDYYRIKGFSYLVEKMNSA